MATRVIRPTPPRDQGPRLRIGRMPVDIDRVAAFEAATPPPATACSSSSLGKDSDECSPPGKEEEEEEEVQSPYVGEGGGGGGLAGLEALEESLPIRCDSSCRRSISKFYSGKSKSFACLKEVITSPGSARDITKAENAYSRKRKNLLAYSILYGNSHDAAAEVYEAGPPKRPASLSRNSLVTLGSISSRSSSSISIEGTELPERPHSRRSPANCDNSASPKIPVPQSGSGEPKTSSVPTRSFSMMDLHHPHRLSSSVRLTDHQETD